MLKSLKMYNYAIYWWCMLLNMAFHTLNQAIFRLLQNKLSHYKTRKHSFLLYINLINAAFSIKRKQQTMWLMMPRSIWHNNHHQATGVVRHNRKKWGTSFECVYIILQWRHHRRTPISRRNLVWLILSKFLQILLTGKS